MLAGGSGITPMFQVNTSLKFNIAAKDATSKFFWSPLTLFYLASQVARAILENPNDKTKVHLIYANVTPEDILLKVITVECQVLFFCF